MRLRTGSGRTRGGAPRRARLPPRWPPSSTLPGLRTPEDIEEEVHRDYYGFLVTAPVVANAPPDGRPPETPRRGPWESNEPPLLGGPRGPGIHPPGPPRPPTGPLGPGRPPRPSDLLPAGLGMADAGAAWRPPVVRAEVAEPPAPPAPTVSAAAPVEAWSMPLVDARFLAPEGVEPALLAGPGMAVQGESASALAVLDGPPGLEQHLATRASGGTVFPPDATRFPGREEPRRAAVAPPHSGDFRLGGPDAPAGSGIGAPSFPVPGSDGVPRWRPMDDAALRTEAADIDAFRRFTALRLPAEGREGDTAQESIASEGPFSYAGWMPSAGLEPSVASPPQVVPGQPWWSTSNTERVAWDYGGHLRTGANPLAPTIAGPAMRMAAEAALRPPAVPGTTANVMVEAPPLAPGVSVQAYPEAPPSGPVPESAGAASLAFKVAIKAGVSVETWRPPKPAIPGMPAARGGRGGIESLLPLEYPLRDEFEAAREDLQSAVEGYESTLGLIPYDADKKGILRQRALRGQELSEAQRRFLESQAALGSFHAQFGSQAAERFAEEHERQDRRREREAAKEKRKGETRPNYGVWKAGSDLRKDLREARDATNDLKAAAGRLRGKGGAEGDLMVRNVRDMADEAMAAQKEADKAGKILQTASRTGSPEDIAAAKTVAEGAQELATLLLAQAQSALGALRKAVLASQGSDEGYAGGAYRPPGPSAVPPDDLPPADEDPGPSGYWPFGCGDPARECGVEAARVPCPGGKVRCHFEEGEVEGSGWGELYPPDSAGPGVDPGVGGVGPPGRGRGVSPFADAEEEVSAPSSRGPVQPEGSPPSGPVGPVPGVKGRGQPKQAGDSKGSTQDSNPVSSAQPGPMSPSKWEPESRTPEDAENRAVEPPPKPETPPDTTPKTSDEDLESESKKTLARLGKFRRAVENKIDLLQWGLKAFWNGVRKENALSKREQRTVRQILGQLAIQRAKRDALVVYEAAVRSALKEGRGSRGALRESAFLFIRKTEWALPMAMARFEESANRTLMDA